ncbi:MAG: substrate-binding domain-containing protein, partial [Cyanobacteria bacterium P01_D01_bin.128]
MTVVSRTLEQQLEASADSDIQVQSVDASAALELMDSGQVDFAAISRPLTDAERAQGWQEETLTREKIAVVIGADNPFQGELTFDQFVDIFRGDLANWSAVGGPDVPIRFLDRPADSDSRVSLSQYEIFKTAPFETGDNTTVLSADDTAELATQLEADGIGYAIASQVLNQSDLRVVPMDGVLPDSDLYPYSQPRNLVYKGTLSPAAQAFLEFALS